MTPSSEVGLLIPSGSGSSEICAGAVAPDRWLWRGCTTVESVVRFDQGVAHEAAAGPSGGGLLR